MDSNGLMVGRSLLIAVLAFTGPLFSDSKRVLIWDPARPDQKPRPIFFITEGVDKEVFEAQTFESADASNSEEIRIDASENIDNQVSVEKQSSEEGIPKNQRRNSKYKKINKS